MKKNRWVEGILMIGLGGIALFYSMQTDRPVQSLLFGLAFSSNLIGIYQIARAVYGSLPRHREKVKEKAEWEEIEKEDERNRMIALRAGNAAYIATLFIVGLAFLLSVIITTGRPEYDPASYILSAIWILVYASRWIAEFILKRV